MTPRNDKIVVKVAFKRLSNVVDDNTRRISRIRKSISKAQLNARFEIESIISSQQVLRNVSRC